MVALMKASTPGKKRLPKVGMRFCLALKIAASISNVYGRNIAGPFVVAFTITTSATPPTEPSSKAEIVCLPSVEFSFCIIRNSSRIAIQCSRRIFSGRSITSCTNVDKKDSTDLLRDHSIFFENASSISSENSSWNERGYRCRRTK